jgi:hypothetical protein
MRKVGSLVCVALVGLLLFAECPAARAGGHCRRARRHAECCHEPCESYGNSYLYLCVNGTYQYGGSYGTQAECTAAGDAAVAAGTATSYRCCGLTSGQCAQLYAGQPCRFGCQSGCGAQAGPAQPGPYYLFLCVNGTWRYGGTFTTPAQCSQVGSAAVASGNATDYKCCNLPGGLCFQLYAGQPCDGYGCQAGH